jgi:hypothetical protein
MQLQASAFWRWTITHRRELFVGTALALTLAILVFAAPLLLLLGAIEWKQSRRQKRLFTLAMLGLLARVAGWLWRDLQGVPHGKWHPCAQCGAPIEAPSRAWFCSPACRRHARLERYAAGGDERAKVQLKRLTRTDACDPELAEVSF